MLKGREIKGLAVFAGNKQEIVGRVNDMLVDDLTGQVSALVIQSNGVLNKNLYVSLNNVRHISKKGVIVPNKKNIKRLPKNSQTLAQKGWIGSKLYSNQGEDKGTVADVLVKDGKVAGLEVSNGLFEDLHRRREFMPWQNVTNQAGNFYEEGFKEAPHTWNDYTG